MNTPDTPRTAVSSVFAYLSSAREERYEMTDLVIHDKRRTPEEILAMIPEGPWWHFDQNNSGGSYSPPAMHVLIVATDSEAAVDRLQSLPDYDDSYCSCCGPRWGDPENLTKGQVAAKLAEWSDPNCWDRTFRPKDTVVLVLP